MTDFVFPVIWVKWLDSALRPNQCDLEELDDFEPVVMENVGWLIKDEKQFVVMSMEIIETERAVRSAVCIPTAQILERRIIQPAPKARKKR